MRLRIAPGAFAPELESPFGAMVADALAAEDKGLNWPGVRPTGGFPVSESEAVGLISRLGWFERPPHREIEEAVRPVVGPWPESETAYLAEEKILRQYKAPTNWLELLERGRRADPGPKFPVEPAFDIVPESWDYVSYDSGVPEPVDPRVQLTIETHVRWVGWSTSGRWVQVTRSLSGMATQYTVSWDTGTGDGSQFLNDIFDGVLYADLESARALED